MAQTLWPLGKKVTWWWGAVWLPNMPLVSHTCPLASNNPNIRVRRKAKSRGPARSGQAGLSSACARAS